jgi:hypothetical protein
MDQRITIYMVNCAPEVLSMHDAAAMLKAPFAVSAHWDVGHALVCELLID